MVPTLVSREHRRIVSHRGLPVRPTDIPLVPTNVQPDGGIGGPTAYATPQWGAAGTVDCGSCHDGEVGHGSPSLIATGSHTKHLEYRFLTSSDRLRCTTCHILNPAGYWNSCRACHPSGYAPPAATHPNGSIDVVFDPYSPWGNPTYNGTPEPGDGYSDCSNTYCHSNGTSVSAGYSADGDTCLGRYAACL